MSGDEAEIAAGFVAREAWAYEAAYRLYGRLLLAAARQVLHDAPEAQDCVHDTLLRLWHHPNAYSAERGSLRAFLAVCVRNDALGRARKRGNRARIDAAQAADAPRGDVADDVATRAAVAGALARLTEQQRETVTLSYFHRLTHAEIAERLGEPVGTVKSRLSAALVRLRQALAEEDVPYAGR